MGFKAKLKKNASFLMFVLMLFAVRWSFADQYQVPSGSMEPTIHVGDRIFVNKAAYHLKVPFTNWIVAPMADPERGDIIVFKSPEESGLTLVKRLIGLPGDRITVKNGFVWVNGTAIEGTQIGAEMLEAATDNRDIFYQERIRDQVITVKRLPKNVRQEELSVEIPAGKYFFMGDNRDNSYDSRYWGFVSRENLKGKALRVLWNFSLADWMPSFDLARVGKSLVLR